MAWVRGSVAREGALCNLAPGFARGTRVSPVAAAKAVATISFYWTYRSYESYRSYETYSPATIARLRA